MTLTSRSEAEQIGYAVETANQLMLDDHMATDLDAHCRWSLGELLDRVCMDDMSPTEVLSVTVILARVHSRVLSGQTAATERTPLARPPLRLVE